MVIPSPKGTIVILIRGSSASDLLNFMVFTLPSLNSSRTDDSGCATDPNQRVLSYTTIPFTFNSFISRSW
ncbi:hypothetical protein HanPSC8_Chr09g0349741 [Helianthus annuus]|nr:hypothetical protein HanPSC8_Chr09g0349741 [Helianthus annuus]